MFEKDMKAVRLRQAVQEPLLGHLAVLYLIQKVSSESMGTGTELQAKELNGGDREGLHIFDFGEVVCLF